MLRESNHLWLAVLTAVDTNLKDMALIEDMKAQILLRNENEHIKSKRKWILIEHQQSQ